MSAQVADEEVLSPQRSPRLQSRLHLLELFFLGYLNRGTKDHVIQAIDTALAARERWSQLPWEHRAAIFLRAADLLAGPYRDRMNAATMLGQGKNAHQAEIDAACEFIDFLRFNAHFLQEIQAGFNGE